MSRFRRQSLIAYGQPLRETVADRPVPRGTEVLIRVTCCGVCHSDLHVQDGYFALGGDKRLDITKDRALPFTLGHEIAGIVEAAGESADGAVVGSEVAIYPWIGCGACPACRAGEENMCSAHHHLGVAVDGGFATFVLVPHPRYLLDHAPLPATFAGPLMCSGLTAYSALKRLGRRAERGPVLLVGLGGVGMMGLALARALFRQPPLVADIDPQNGKPRSPPAPRKPSIRPIRRPVKRSWRPPAAVYTQSATLSVRTNRCNSRLEFWRAAARSLSPGSLAAASRFPRP